MAEGTYGLVVGNNVAIGGTLNANIISKVCPPGRFLFVEGYSIVFNTAGGTVSIIIQRGGTDYFYRQAITTDVQGLMNMILEPGDTLFVRTTATGVGNIDAIFSTRQLLHSTTR